MARVATVWVISQVPSTFSRMTVRKPFGVMSSAGVRYCPPALFTSRSIWPWRSKHAVHERLDLVLLADVARARLDAAVLRRGGGLLEWLEPPAADHHLRAQRRQL